MIPVYNLIDDYINWPKLTEQKTNFGIYLPKSNFFGIYFGYI